MPDSPASGQSAFGTLDVAAPELLRSVVDHSPTMLAYFDSGLICRYGNASYRRVFEAPGQVLEGEHFESLVLPQMRDLIMPRARAALTGLPQDFEYERPMPHGGSMHVEVKYTPDVREGRVAGMFVELHDITSHKRIEELVLESNRHLEEHVRERSARLFDSEQRFRLMVDGLQDYCIYFLDELGRVTDWTDSAQRMHGLMPAQVLRQPIAQLLDDTHPGQHPGFQAQLLRQAIEQGYSETDGWQIRAGQPAFWAHTMLTALRDPRGELQGLSVITRDMTEAKRLEDMLNQLNQELEKRVAERSRELMLANRDIDAFAHMVSHDLRAPLRHISGYLTLLREDLQEQLHIPDTSDIYHHTSAMDQACKRLSRMIESTLEYARLGRTTVEAAPTPLGPVIEAALASARQAAGDRNITWVLPEHWPTVQGDPALLTQLFSQLLDNAVKYTRTTDAARIEMGWRAADASDPQPSGYTHSGPQICFWIQDNGVGFDSEHANNLFVMFQRQHHSMDFEGSGTGLALGQRIVGLHRGTLRIQSQPGHGCRATVTLPTAEHTPV